MSISMVNSKSFCNCSRRCAAYDHELMMVSLKYFFEKYIQYHAIRGDIVQRSSSCDTYHYSVRFSTSLNLIFCLVLLSEFTIYLQFGTNYLKSILVRSPINRKLSITSQLYYYSPKVKNKHRKNVRHQSSQIDVDVYYKTSLIAFGVYSACFIQYK